jgi:hypothetical protein
MTLVHSYSATITDNDLGLELYLMSFPLGSDANVTTVADAALLLNLPVSQDFGELLSPSLGDLHSMIGSVALPQMGLWPPGDPSDQDARLRGSIGQLIDHAIAAPVLPVQQSWPHFTSLGERVAVGGSKAWLLAVGSGAAAVAGGAVAGPAGAVVAIVLVEGAAILAFVRPAVARKLMNMITPARSDLAELKEMHDAGLMDDATYHDAVRSVMADRFPKKPD